MSAPQPPKVDKSKMEDGTPKPPSGDSVAAELAALQKRVEEGEAREARLNRQLEETESKLSNATAQQAAGVTPGRAKALADRKAGKRKSAMTRAECDALRAEIKAAARTEGGFKLYRVGAEKFYRLGVVTPPFHLVRLPIDEDPSMTWKPIVAKGKVAEVEDPDAEGVVDDRIAISAMGKGTRAADQQVG